MGGTDSYRGYFSFTNDFGRDAITNLGGTPTQYLLAIGNFNRGFRNWDMQYFGGDTWRIRSNLTLNYGLRYQPVLRPVEVNQLNILPYASDRNNWAPYFGLAYRLPGEWGVLRSAYGLHYGQIFPVTFQQVRFSPPSNLKIVVQSRLAGPWRFRSINPNIRSTYVMDPELVALLTSVRLELGGDRSPKMASSVEAMWAAVAQAVTDVIFNRANQFRESLNHGHGKSRRRDPQYAEIRRVLNNHWVF
jgi:hypothetical protein